MINHKILYSIFDSWFQIGIIFVALLSYSLKIRLEEF